MPTKVHFINVGQGNMTLIQAADGKTFLYDCNITNDNERSVFEYLGKQLPAGTKLDGFICSHRDSDHMRGVKKVHAKYPIKVVYDTGVTGTTPTCTEYKEYMELRRAVGFKEVAHKTRYDFGNTRFRIMNAKNDDLADNANAQSIVMKVVHRDSSLDRDHGSVMLTGDTDAVTWKTIRKHYGDADLACSILLASHHGSLTYFDDPSDTQHYYTSHTAAKAPGMTIVSVGNNAHGHPHAKSLEFYEKYSKGSSKGNKLFRTDLHGHICVALKDGGGWNIAKEK